jgi:hypothetical protein
MEKQYRKGRTYAICVENTGYPAALELRKLYPLATPKPNDPPTMLRVIDESGEDYLYPAKWFLVIDLPAKAKRALASV